MAGEFVLRDDGAIELKLDLRVYRLTAIKKTAYRLAERCTAVFGEITGDLTTVTLHSKTRSTEGQARETARLFFEDLLDQELREQIAQETGAIRTMILAQAFSKTDLIRRE